MSKVIVMMTIFTLTGCNLKMGSAITAEPLPQNQETAVSVAGLNIGFESLKLSSVRNCIKCHAPGKQKPELTSIETFKDHQDEVLDEVSTNSMPPTDKGYSLLSACYKDLLQKWFDLGAPENSEIKITSLDKCKDLK